MFRSKLASQIRKIFGITKVTFDLPGESSEQEGVFIDVTKARTRVKDTRHVARVEGVIRIFAASEKLPYGFFAKKIDAASADDKEGLFFFDFEENKGKFRNIIERSVSFQYFFDGQYNPAIGTIESVNISITES